MKNKAHLTKEGLYEIRLIKSGMNKARKLKYNNTQETSGVDPETKKIFLKRDLKSINKKCYSTYTIFNPCSCVDEHINKIKFDEWLAGLIDGDG